MATPRLLKKHGGPWAIPALALLAAAAGCALVGSQVDPPPDPKALQPNVVSLDPQQWYILYSGGMPAHPSADPEGAWSFEFPMAPDPTCQAAPCGHLNYVETPFNNTGDPESITVSFEVQSDNAVWTAFSDNLPATCRIMIETEGDDLRSADGRFWADGVGVPLQIDPFNLGTQPVQYASFTIPLVPASWTNVFGQVDPQGFADLLTNWGWTGITFGGQDAAGHGNAVVSGSAKFILLDYKVNY